MRPFLPASFCAETASLHRNELKPKAAGQEAAGLDQPAAGLRILLLQKVCGTAEAVAAEGAMEQACCRINRSELQSCAQCVVSACERHTWSGQIMGPDLKRFKMCP